ncbi:MAG: hypothetical protein RIT38_661, partial [Bacteroidota bacterium]
DFFKRHYSHTNSLESAFTKELRPEDLTIENGLNGFYQYFFDSEWSPERTKKHIASPLKNSACKRINMLIKVIKVVAHVERLQTLKLLKMYSKSLSKYAPINVFQVANLVVSLLLNLKQNT